MQELINQLTEKAGISPDQANKAIATIKDFVKEKFPMLSGAVDNMFAGSAETTTTAASASTTTAAATPVTEDSGSMLDKISDVIPGGVGEKIEDFAKNLFGGDKK